MPTDSKPTKQNPPLWYPRHPARVVDLTAGRCTKLYDPDNDKLDGGDRADTVDGGDGWNICREDSQVSCSTEVTLDVAKAVTVSGSGVRSDGTPIAGIEVLGGNVSGMSTPGVLSDEAGPFSKVIPNTERERRRLSGSQACVVVAGGSVVHGNQADQHTLTGAGGVATMNVLPSNEQLWLVVERTNSIGIVSTKTIKYLTVGTTGLTLTVSQ